ncbi:nose resistant to fluoxetine protein 6-like [Cydia amplana]|uniref:nose resistant to fluoxetine protein 6-like n=1 Tax=Cydia amplana TaxID=1869771 RepID=UPI002FE5A28A
MAKLIFLIIFVIYLCSVGAYIEFEVPRHVFDTELYENVLDEELCEAQLSYLLNNNTMLTAEFLDAGIRLPRGILHGNFVDLGYYHQCLAISENFNTSDIEGKYCMINIPMVQDELNVPALPEWPGGSERSVEWPKVPWMELFSITRPHSDMFRNLQKVRTEAAKYSLTGPDLDLMRVSEDSLLANQVFKLAVCLPKVCSPKQFIDTVFVNTTSVGFKLTEDFCRLRNDKPFAPVDYAAISEGLFKNIHLFYLHRLLRMFPVLATVVFLQASLFNHLSDGPEWHIVVDKVERCRACWWATLTYVQNYVTDDRCIGPSWYLAVDMQLHILSPIILFWVLGRRRSAWTALTLVMMVVMVVSTTYNYLNKFQTASFVLKRFVFRRSQEDARHYLRYYYHNTLTRCSPFFVGMLFGYLLNMYKSKEVHMARWFVASCWFCAFAVSAGIIYSAYPVLQMDWDSPFWDGIINSFARPGWAVCVGWVIFACTHGYGGPVNWFLSLRMWKLPSRLSYAMYIFHYSLMVVVNTTSVSASHFSVERYFYRFLADFVTAFIVAFVATVLIDSPFSTLIKLAIGGSKTGTVKTKQGCEDENKQ